MRFAMTWHQRVKVEFSKPFQRMDPVDRIAAKAVRNRMHDEITGREDALSRQPHDQIARRIAATEVQNMNLAITALQDEAVIDQQIRRRDHGSCELIAHEWQVRQQCPPSR